MGGRHRGRELDLLAGEEEDRAGPMEFERTHRQNHRCTPSAAETAHRVEVGREVNMGPGTFPKSARFMPSLKRRGGTHWYRPPAPEAAAPPLPASGSASLHLRLAMAAETTMH